MADELEVHDAVHDLGREQPRPAVVDLFDDDDPSRHAGGLREHELRIPRVMQHRDQERDGERLVGERQGHAIDELRHHTGLATPVVHVDRGDGEAARSQAGGDHAGSSADVDHRPARDQVRQDACDHAVHSPGDEPPDHPAAPS